MKKGKIVECNNCHKQKPLYSKGLCASCYGYARNKVYQARQVGKYKAKYNDMEAFYQKFWNSQTDKKCFECGNKLWIYKNYNVHHIAYKSKYPQYSNQEDVCVLLCLECHSKWHAISKLKLEQEMPNTYNRFLELKNKYNIELYT